MGKRAGAGAGAEGRRLSTSKHLQSGGDGGGVGLEVGFIHTTTSNCSVATVPCCLVHPRPGELSSGLLLGPVP